MSSDNVPINYVWIDQKKINLDPTESVCDHCYNDLIECTDLSDMEAITYFHITYFQVII